MATKDTSIILARLKYLREKELAILNFYTYHARVGAKCCTTEFSIWVMKVREPRMFQLFGNLDRPPWYQFKKLERFGFLESELESDIELEIRPGGGRKRYYSITEMGRIAFDYSCYGIAGNGYAYDGPDLVE